MSRREVSNNGCPQEIQILIFTVSGVRIGVDADQVDEMMDIEMAEERELTIYHIHKKVLFGSMPVVYQTPKVIVIKDGSTPYGVIIDHPNEIAAVNVASIQPLPRLIACASPSPFWGVVARHDGIVLLIDCNRFSGGTGSVETVDLRKSKDKGGVYED